MSEYLGKVLNTLKRFSSRWLVLKLSWECKEKCLKVRMYSGEHAGVLSGKFGLTAIQYVLYLFIFRYGINCPLEIVG